MFLSHLYSCKSVQQRILQYRCMGMHSGLEATRFDAKTEDKNFFTG